MFPPAPRSKGHDVTEFERGAQWLEVADAFSKAIETIQRARETRSKSVELRLRVRDQRVTPRLPPRGAEQAGGGHRGGQSAGSV